MALGLPDVALVVCLCGRNDAVRQRLLDRFGRDGRVRIEGFTEQMPDWLAAADVLIHSTAGLTMLEALMRGCPAISFGWGRGHIRVNNEAFRTFDLIEVAGSNAELAGVLASALAAPRASPAVGFAELPSAASFVIAEATRAKSVALGG